MTAAPSSPPGWPACPYQRGRHRAARSAATRGGLPTRSCGRTCAGWPPRCSARAPPRSSASPATGSTSTTRRAACALAAEVTPRGHLSRRARGAAGVRRRHRSATSTWSAARCSPHARRTPGGSTCSASAARSARIEARAVLAAGRHAGLIPRVHACQLGPRTRRPGRGRGRRRVSGSLHLPVRRGRGRAARLRGTVATLLPARGVLHPPAIPGRAAAARRGRHRRARDRLQSGLVLHVLDGLRASRSRCVELRMTTQEAVWAATAGGARALRRTDVGHLAPGARADLLHARRPVARLPGLPAGRPAGRRPSGGMASSSSTHGPIRSSPIPCCPIRCADNS